MRLVLFGGVALPESNAEDSLPVAARSALVHLQDGSFDQDGYEAHFQPIKLSHRCVVVGQPGQDVDDEVDSLLAILAGGRRILRAKMRNGVDYRQTWAKVLAVQRERGTGTPYRQPLVIELEQDYPYWLATEDEPWYLDNGNYLDAGLALDAGNVETESITSSPHNFTVSNGGTVAVRRGIIQIEPAAGASITNPKIENFISGTWLQYVGTVAAGELLEIDLLTQTIELDGANAYSDLSVADKHNWMELATGANTIRVTGSISGTVVLRWRWAKHYL